MSEREFLDVLHIQLLEQLMDHEPFKPQPKELDRKVGPPSVGSSWALAENLLYLELWMK